MVVEMGIDRLGEMAELTLLLPAWQAEALERVACAEGLTVGQLLRRLVNRTVSQHAPDAGERVRPDQL